MEYRKDKKGKKLRLTLRLTAVLITLVTALLAIAVLIATTSPDSAGPLGVTLFFVLIFVVTLSILTLVKMSIKRTTSVYVGDLISIALVPSIILALNTLKQLTVLDLMLIVVFVVLINFYLKRALGKRNTN